jgi:hypothetical protein
LGRRLILSRRAGRSGRGRGRLIACSLFRLSGPIGAAARARPRAPGPDPGGSRGLGRRRLACGRPALRAFRDIDGPAGASATLPPIQGDPLAQPARSSPVCCVSSTALRARSRSAAIYGASGRAASVPRSRAARMSCSSAAAARRASARPGGRAPRCGRPGPPALASLGLAGPAGARGLAHQAHDVRAAGVEELEVDARVRPPAVGRRLRGAAAGDAGLLGPAPPTPHRLRPSVCAPTCVVRWRAPQARSSGRGAHAPAAELLATALATLASRLGAYKGEERPGVARTPSDNRRISIGRLTGAKTRAQR